jgi:hypothetical protein
MLFPPDFLAQDMPLYWEEFVKITGFEPWKRRIDQLSSRMKANFLTHLLLKRFELELTFAAVRKHKQNTGHLNINVRTLTDSEYFLYAFISFVVRTYRRLSNAGKARLKGMIQSGLKTEGGLSSIQHEVHIASQLMRRGFDVSFSDIESGGGFDFLARKQGVEVEVECKACSRDKGQKIHLADMPALHKKLEPIINTLRRNSQSKIIEVTVPARLGSTTNS